MISGRRTQQRIDLQATQRVGGDHGGPPTDLARVNENPQLTIGDKLIENSLDPDKAGDLLTIVPVDSHEVAESRCQIK